MLNPSTYTLDAQSMEQGGMFFCRGKVQGYLAHKHQSTPRTQQ